MSEVRPEELLAATLADQIPDVRHIAVGAASPIPAAAALLKQARARSEEHTSELQSH